MEYRLGQSRGQYDFDLYHPNGDVSAVEATSAVNKTVEETYASIRNPKKGGPFVRSRLCKKGWWVHPGLRANINLIRSRVDEYLSAIESAGIERFFATTDLHNPSVERIYRDLDVIGGDVFPWKEPCQIGIAFPSGGGALNAGTAIEAAEGEAFKIDNRRKLGAAGTGERHLAVYVYLTNYRPWCALCDFDPPPGLPHPPSEITHLWLFSETRSHHEYVVWQASTSVVWHSRRVLLTDGA
jgi:hypothetical protein